MPHLAAWGKLQIDNSLGAVGMDKPGQVGVLHHGLEVLGGGAILGGLMLGAIAVFVIGLKMMKAAIFAFAAAVCTFVGLIHGEAIGFGQSLPVAFSCLIVAVILFLSGKFAEITPASAETY